MIVNQAALDGIYRSFSTIFNQAALEVKDILWPQFATRIPSSGKEVNYKWMGNWPMMREWLGERVVKDLRAFDFTIKNKSFESTIGVDRDDVEDDQVGVYKPMVQGLAQTAMVHPDLLLFLLFKAGFSEFCYDGQYFFDTDHPVGGQSVSNFGGGTGTPWYLLDLSRPLKPFVLQVRKKPKFVSVTREDSPNVFMQKKFLYGVDDRKNVGFGLWQLAYGSKTTLDATNYEAGYLAMQNLANDEGVPLGIQPTHLVVPPSLRAVAKKLIEAMLVDGGDSNIYYKDVKLEVVRWLR